MAKTQLHNILFSVNEYDKDGDITEEGIYLHFGEFKVRVAKDMDDFHAFIGQIQGMSEEIAENYFSGT